ncbi:hypothetical protein BpHYR1_053244, partial [Brachionus plicatilis]
NRTRVINETSYTLEETHVFNKTVNLNTTVNKSPIAMKESLSANISYDLVKITEELEKSFSRFNSIDVNFDSLFNETITGLDPHNGGPISPLGSPKQSVNNLTINLDDVKPQTHLTLQKQESLNSPLSSSLSASIDNLDNLQFNPSSVPKTFDLFITDLKKSSSTFTLNSLDTGSQTNLNSNFPVNLSKRIITSSIDKDLNKELKSNKIKNLSHLNENDPDVKTSSPLKKKPALNCTIDLNGRNSNESLNESEQSLSVSQSSSISNLNDDPRTVFNSTYTAWTPTDQQIQFDAFNQQRRLVQSNSGFHLNRTQDMNNNHNKDDLNKTKDIITDSQEDLNRTRDVKPAPIALNKTKELTESNGVQIKAVQVRRISSINQNTRPTSMYSKSKLVNCGLSAKPAVGLPQTKAELKRPNIGSKLAQPLVSQSADLTKPKTGIAKVATVSKSVVSPIRSPAQIQRPNALATNNSNLNRGLASNSSQNVNLNRLSSTSSSSSASTCSSSSLKENKKMSNTQAKSAANTKLATLGTMNQNVAPSRLKPPTVSASIPKSSNVPQSKMAYENGPKSFIKPPSQIPTFKSSSGIPTFRNSTNQVKK